MSVVVRDLQTLFGVGATGAFSDEELLSRFVARREEAVFEAIVHRHGPMVWGVCRRVLRDHHDAEDAFQATFLVLARKAAAVKEREKLGNWLYGVAHQTAMKARATRTKRRGREGQVPDMPESMAVPDDQRDDLAESLDRELSRLPEKYRIPVVLCDLEGRTHREAASQLGWPIGTVSSRLARARAKLARRLSPPGMTLSGGTMAVLMVQESASASVPTRLIGSTAQAASLYAAGGAAAAGMVSAEVAALTREVMKMMLLSKIKVAPVMLLVASALAVGGTGLAYRAQAEGPPKVVKRTNHGPAPKNAEVQDEGPSHTAFKLGEIDVEGAEKQIGREEREDQGVGGVTLGIANKRLAQLEEAIAAGVMEAETAAKGKSPQQVQEMIEELTAKWEQDRIKIRATEAALRRLVQIRDGNTRTHRNIGVGR